MNSLQKRPLTLIEVSIAFGILAVCFSIVFSNFHISSKLIAKTDTARQTLYKKQRFMQRISLILEHLQPGSLTIEEALQQKEPTKIVTFIYENGLDRERIFSGVRKGEISFQGNALLLTTFSKDEKEAREEVLFKPLLGADFTLDATNVLYFNLTDSHKSQIPFAFILPREMKP